MADYDATTTTIAHPLLTGAKATPSEAVWDLTTTAAAGKYTGIVKDSDGVALAKISVASYPTVQNAEPTGFTAMILLDQAVSVKAGAEATVGASTKRAIHAKDNLVFVHNVDCAAAGADNKVTVTIPANSLTKLNDWTEEVQTAFTATALCMTGVDYTSPTVTATTPAVPAGAKGVLQR
jgi:hypothetical protein